MAFPPYLNLIGLGIPLLVGLVGFGIYFFNQRQLQQEHQHQHRYNYPRQKRISFCDDSETCSICLEIMNPEDSSPLNCGHRLHDTCLVELNKREQNKCPTCRAQIIY